MLNIKHKLFQACHDFVNHKLRTTQDRIQSLQNDLQSETKSSAGDKHETGRAMLHLEIEKTAQQLNSIHQMREVMDRIDLSKKFKIVSLGSLIETNIGNYFLAISLGQHKIDDRTYFIVSTSSPIGKELMGKKEGSELLFNGRKIQINTIS